MHDNSLEAIRNIEPRLGLIQEQIMSFLPQMKQGTCAEIGLRCGLTEEQVRKRMTELERAGLVKRSDKKFTYIHEGHTYHKTIWEII